jgi:lysophospholipid acyltransferase (LPLAT)-like uncharacterized protein
LRYDQSFSAELLFEPDCTAGGKHAHRIIQIEPHGNVANRSADVEWCGNDGGCVDAQRRRSGNLHAHAPEIQRQSNRAAGFEHGKFSGAANIDLAAGRESHARLPHMHGDHAAIRHRKAGKLSVAATVRQTAISKIGRACAAFHRYVVAFHAADYIRGPLLGAQRGSREKNKCRRKKRVCETEKKSAAGSAVQEGPENSVMAARELCSGVHPDLLEVLYYTAVANDAKSAVPRDAQTSHQQFDARPPELSRWRRMEIPVIAWAVYGVMRLIGPTLRVEMVGVQNAVQIREAGEAAIGAFWHRCIFSAIWVWRKRGIVVLNTVNFDGQWTRRVIERLGFGTAQGSSTRGAIEGLTIMASRLEEGKHVALTIDGPRGPRYVAKPGAVILARRTGKPVSVFHLAAQSAYTFKKSWDLFQLPFPFSRVVMFVAPPIRVPTDADSEVIHQKQKEIQAALERVRDVAESWFGLSEDERERLREEWSDRATETSPIARTESEPG